MSVELLLCILGLEAIACLIAWVYARRRRQAAAAMHLAQDLGVPVDSANRVLQQTMRELSSAARAGDDFDARPIIERAVAEFSKGGFQILPIEDAVMERYLQQLPDRDYEILRLFKLGKTHSEIAELMDIGDVQEVRCSLVRTYADLRIRMSTSRGPDGGGEPLPAEHKVA